MTARSRSGWPASLVRFAELIGDPLALKLVADFGGIRVYVPREPKPDQPLVRALGLQAAAALADEFGGEEIEVPNAAVLRNKKRAILAIAGNNARTARATGSTERYVRMVRNAGAQADPRQEELPFPGTASG